MKIDHFDFNSNRTFIIAELSANHRHDLDLAIQTIREAKKAGADAIKLQTYTADTLTIDCDKDDFKIKGTIWEGQNLHALYSQAYTPWSWHKELFDTAKEEGLIVFSTPFDKSSVDFLETLDPPAYKIASFEITDIPLISYIASKGKPVIISTGIASLADIELAIETIKSTGNEQIILLKCTSSYPAPIEQANLIMIKEFQERFKVISGLSDHTIGSLCPIIAVSYGARVIEKHFIIDQSIGGPDASFSMNKDQFKEMVDQIRLTEKAIGKVDYTLTDKQREGTFFSRSLYVTQDVAKGDFFTHENVRSIRPGYGLHPRYLPKILGKKANKTLSKGTRFSLDFIDGTL